MIWNGHFCCIWFCGDGNLVFDESKTFFGTKVRYSNKYQSDYRQSAQNVFHMYQCNLITEDVFDQLYGDDESAAAPFGAKAKERAPFL